MSIPDETLQKLALEIDSQAIVAQQQLGSIRTQIAAKHREQRLVRLTFSEVVLLPRDAVLYRGLGKMFTLTTCQDLTQELDNQIRELGIDIQKLSQRLQYLETTYRNCQCTSKIPGN
ncbi:hypothetical protein XA68_11364 [Ophiocordyceps unilateralis]|uniref:Prefoldin subunit 1 n=1 Tax=Ophiocordyceps unilateralis TaxID=268505 RepID=A0A2A9NX84_OPHUN|nr:hypothetical protein XA68_11364 [Ophiocordyceps unilateralis]